MGNQIEIECPLFRNQSFFEQFLIPLPSLCAECLTVSVSRVERCFVLGEKVTNFSLKSLKMGNGPKWFLEIKR